MPMIEADKEALAYLRAGYLLPDDMIRERGFDPDTHWEEYGKQMKGIREAGAVLAIDASLRTQAGNAVAIGQEG